MTDSSQLNPLLLRSRAEAEKELPLLAAVYEKALRLLAGDASRTFSSLTAATWQPAPEGSLLRAVDAVAASIAVTQARLQKRILKLVAGDPLARLGIAWDVKHPLSEDMLARAGGRTGQRLGAAATPILRDTVGKAYEQGLAVPETAALIRANLEDAAPWQAEMLARTDLNGLANGGSVIAATLAGAGYKTWLATMDDRTRDTHAEADGQTVPVAHAFTVGGEQLEYPGDPSGSDAEVANCRCTVTYSDALRASAGGRAPMRGLSSRGTMAQSLTDTRIDSLVAAAIPYKQTPVVDQPWDGNAAMTGCSSAADYRSICAWTDTGGDPAERGSYKFPHHGKPGGPANVNGVRNALARLPQASIPAADMAGVRAHLEAHLNAFNKNKPAASILAAMPDGVKECSMGGTPGYTGGGACHVHDGSEPGKSSAMQKAQRDAKKKMGAALLAAGTPGCISFTGVAAIEGIVTDDNSPMPRVLLARSLSWPDLPVPFMAQTVTAEGHDGAEVAGRIDSFKRSQGDNGSWNIEFAGELTTPFGISEIAPMVEDQTLRGVSVDLGASAWAIVDADTLAPVPEDELDIEAMAAGQYLMGLTSGKIRAATLTPVQAIEGAHVALTASADAGYTVHARANMQLKMSREGLVASAAPAAPPRDWFETPEPPGKMPLTITPEGRVFGHLAPWDGCHMGFAESSCVSPPRSRSGYAYFHVGEITTDDGETLPVGKLMLAAKGGKHAHVGLSKNDAARHYDDTSMVAAHLRAVDGRFGIWVAGALSSRLTDAQVRELRSLSPSGDWRPVGMDLEMICALAVPVPGYPIPRADVEMIRVGEELRVKSLVASAGLFDADPAAERALVSQGLLDERDTDARTRALVARAEGGIDGLLALATGGTDA